MMRARLFFAAFVWTFMAVPAALANPSLLVDLTNGNKVLHHEQAFHPWRPASLTKLMTTYVAFRAVAAGELQMNSPIEITERATKEPPSKMGYAAGSILTLDNAIKILMVKSANDVATAIADNVGGSVDAFAARMNAEAARLGMTGTHYVNAHGLHHDDQYTTARDQALLAIALKRDFPQYADYFSLEAITAGDEMMENHNMLIGRFTGANGMKTGYTCPSGFNVVSSARQQGRELLAVVLGAHSVEERADEAANLLGNGFAEPAGDALPLAMLTPATSVAAEPVNLRSVVCTEEAWKKRAKRRDDEGNSIYFSPFIHERTDEPVAVAVSLGGATGPRTTQPRYADVPIPTPRPQDYQTQTAQGG